MRLVAPRPRGRGGRTSPSPARRSNGLPASRRRGWRAARHRPVRAPSRRSTGMNSTACRLPERDRAGLVEQQRVHVAGRLRPPCRSSPARCAASRDPCRRCRWPRAGRRSSSESGRPAAKPEPRLVGAVPAPADATLHRCANGCSVTTASRKISVKPAIRMFSAISFGVFWRSAPSTSAIMRSRNVSPGFDVIRIRDLVRQHLRAAGHGAAVAARFADHRRALAGDHRFVHGGDAFDHFAVAGNQVARFADHHVARAQLRGRNHSRLRRWPATRFAIVSVFVLRSVSACALPRASAIASAKLANSTVNQSHSEICRPKPSPAAPVTTSRISEERSSAPRRPRPRTSPDSCTSVIGFSLTNESPDGAPHDLRIEQRTCARSASAEAATVRSSGARRTGRLQLHSVTAMSSDIALRTASRQHQEVLDDRAQRERRERTSARRR